MQATLGASHLLETQLMVEGGLRDDVLVRGLREVAAPTHPSSTTALCAYASSFVQATKCVV